MSPRPPYGPFKLFLSKDFGGYPWTGDKHGGYACTIPSKFISEDGREMWVFSATFNGGAQQYRFTGRKLVVDPYDPEGPQREGRGQPSCKKRHSLYLL